MRPWATATVIMLACGLGACASAPPPAPRAPDLDSLVRASEQDRCHGAIKLADHHVATAGVRDAEAVRVVGHPYLRTNRFLASFREEPLDAAALRDWVAEMRRLDREGRVVELANLPQERTAAVEQGIATLGFDGRPKAVLARCGDLLAEALLDDPEAQAALGTRVRVPDNYSTARRVFGLYPLTAVGVTTGFDAWKREHLASFDQDPADLPVTGRLTDYAPAEAASDDGRALVASAPRNGLGMPVFTDDQIVRLAALHAPRFRIDVAGDFDRPGAPALTGANGTVLPTVRTDRPVVYFRLSHTRFDGAVLPQLVYTVWFSERPPDGGFDIYSGRLDGVVWRVTLAPDGTPMVYDSMHPCGCYHLFFPVPPTVRKDMPEDKDAREGAVVPATAPRLAPGERIVVRLASANHYIQAIGKTAAGSPTDEKYDLILTPEPDGPLRMLDLPDGSGTRSLYDEVGLVAGSERAERWLLWPMGIDSAGAMRQWGTHATAFVGRRHFDDQDLFDRAFSR